MVLIETTASGCILEFTGLSSIIPVTVQYSFMSIRTNLPIDEVFGNNFSARDLESTILFGPSSTSIGEPASNGKLNIWKKVESAMAILSIFTGLVSLPSIAGNIFIRQAFSISGKPLKNDIAYSLSSRALLDVLFTKR